MMLNTIYNDDCMANLDNLPSESVDLAILDPDYDDWDRLLSEDIVIKTLKTLKPTGNIICFTKQPFDYSLRIAINPIFRREFSWSFDNGGAWVSNRMPLVSFQKIYWCTPTKDFYFNPRTGMAYSEGTKDCKRTSKVFGGYKEEGHMFEKSEDGIWMRDHYHYNKPSFGDIPAKPLELMRIFIRCLCPEGGVVLDPFMGSGTTAIACHKENRHYIGYELDKERYSLIQKRVKAETSQLNLF